MRKNVILLFITIFAIGCATVNKKRYPSSKGDLTGNPVSPSPGNNFTGHFSKAIACSNAINFGTNTMQIDSDLRNDEFAFLDPSNERVLFILKQGLLYKVEIRGEISMKELLQDLVSEQTEYNDEGAYFNVGEDTYALLPLIGKIATEDYNLDGILLAKVDEYYLRSRLDFNFLSQDTLRRGFVEILKKNLLLEEDTIFAYRGGFSRTDELMEPHPRFLMGLGNYLKKKMSYESRVNINLPKLYENRQFDLYAYKSDSFKNTLKKYVNFHNDFDLPTEKETFFKKGFFQEGDSVGNKYIRVTRLNGTKDAQLKLLASLFAKNLNQVTLSGERALKWQKKHNGSDAVEIKAREFYDNISYVQEACTGIVTYPELTGKLENLNSYKERLTKKMIYRKN